MPRIMCIRSPGQGVNLGLRDVRELVKVLLQRGESGLR